MNRIVILIATLLGPVVAAEAAQINWNVPSGVVGSGASYSVSAYCSSGPSPVTITIYKSGAYFASGMMAAGGSTSDTGPKTVTFTASAPGYPSSSRTVTISGTNTPPSSASISLSQATITFGQSITVTGTLYDPDGNLSGHSLWTNAPAANGSQNPNWVPATRPITPEGSGNWTGSPNIPASEGVWSGGAWYNGAPSQGTNSSLSGTFTPKRAGIWVLHTNGRDGPGAWGPGDTKNLTVNKAPITPPTSTNATTTYGTPWSPTYSGGTTGAGALIYNISGFTNWGTAAYPPNAGTYTFYVGQQGNANYVGGTNDPLIRDVAVNPTGYTLTVYKANQAALSIGGAPSSLVYNTTSGGLTASGGTTGGTVTFAVTTTKTPANRSHGKASRR